MSGSEKAIAAARRVFEIEIKALEEVMARIDGEFTRAVEAILNANAKLVVSGMGKSGHVGQKLAATLASTGTPSFFVHPAEAFHGDLGMIEKSDVVLLISYSGETDEVLKIIPYLKWNKNTIIAISGNPSSTLARESDIHFNIAVSQEACPLELAPTSSTTATLVIGDALAVALMEARGFQPEDFARFHPGGSLGRRLLHRVRDYTQTENLPYMASDANAKEMVLKLSEGRLGLVIIQDADQRVVGVITDGDLRRAMNEKSKLEDIKVSELMSTNPITISADLPIHEAEQLMLDKKILSVLVEEEGKVIGVCQLYSIYGTR